MLCALVSAVAPEVISLDRDGKFGVATVPALYANLEPCNAFSLAASTGIPRETVRRKIDQLVKRGWVQKDANGLVRIRPEVGEHFRPDFNVRLLRELLKVSDELKKVMDSTPSGRGDSARPASKG